MRHGLYEGLLVQSFTVNRHASFTLPIMIPIKVRLARGRRQANNQRGHYSVCKMMGLLCMVLALATTVRASNSQIGVQNVQLAEVQPRQEPLSGEKGPRDFPLNRVAIIGKPVNTRFILHCVSHIKKTLLSHFILIVTS